MSLPLNTGKIGRRQFIRDTAVLGMAGVIGASYDNQTLGKEMKTLSPIRIKNVDSNIEREPLYPYRFKGSVISEGWQTAAYLESDSGIHKVGIGGQGILWSDSKVFA
ncbi:MAG TPA: hypothetical protein VFO37_09880, partial [Chitinophagaceae bacterium]|nr:hypothetical protein [Chitinophagaceae bacterium]